MKQYSDKQIAQMKALFERVENKSNWKLPINAIAVLDEKDIPILEEAIIFYTGSIAIIDQVSTHVYRVTASGYYAVIGA